MSTWNPELYLKFGKERTQPSIDLLARISHAEPARILDVGCGPGNSTAVLRKRWPNAKIIGLDSSSTMIESAQKFYPSESWLLADIANYHTNEPFDLLFANATLQWLENHELLIPHLLTLLNPSGILAVQVPANGNSPLSEAVHRVSNRPEWKAFAPKYDEIPNYRTPTYYYNLLTGLALDFDLWQTSYYHIQNSHLGIIEWSRATALRPWLDRLPSDLDRRRFEAELQKEIAPQYPVQLDGRILFPFPRTFFTVVKPA